MRNKARPKLIVIVGPTASGKSEFSLRLAKKINGEIISADSRQAYKGLDIGTAKLSQKERRGVKHHCLDMAWPQKTLSVAEYKKCAEHAIDTIYRNGKVPILVGGTAFYIRAVVDGLVLPEVPPNLKLRIKLEKYSAEKLFRILKKKDPHRAKTIEPKNKRRLIRALEIIEALGKVPKIKAYRKHDATFIGIKRKPEELKKLIEKRTQKMLKRGLLFEVRKLKKSGLSRKRLYEFGFEYKYPDLFLRKKISKKEMVNLINKETLDYARRQTLWWKNDRRIKWRTPR